LLKAGAAYVPMDPGWPVARIGFVVGDAAPVVVTTAGLRGRLAGLGVVVVDVDDVGVGAQSGAGLPVPAGDGVAFVIYIWGTTGVPSCRGRGAATISGPR